MSDDGRLSPERLEYALGYLHVAANPVMHEIADYIVFQQAEIARLTEWRNAVSGAIKTAPYFEAGEWGGDKEGWGYHLEQVGWLIRERGRLQAQVAAARLEGAQELVERATRLRDGTTPYWEVAARKWIHQHLADMERKAGQ